MDRRLFIGAAGATLALPSLVHAQAKPIRLVVPFVAGGATDVTARLIAEKAATTLGQPVIIENRPGGGGNIGVDVVAKAAPDGLTIGMAAVAMHAINPWLFKKMPYDAVKDFAPITQMVRIPNVLVMNAETAKRLNINNLKDFIAYAKANPAKLSYASGGNGSGGHLAGEMFKTKAGIFAVHIPYNGGGPSQLAMLSGTVDFTLDNLATSGANIRAGKVVPLAVTTLKRSSLLPEVPAMAETWPGFEIDTWWGLIAPAATPKDVVLRLNKAFTGALESQDIKTKFAGMMAEPVPTTPEQFADLIKREYTRYEGVVKASGAKVD
ncbi:MAG: tripartite tricarboxylate transporter substrate binding protein [Comamonadaceae bacterium]|nr:MAG: tripartite tricarboxylate transporter substrate binding protein [Comamonadaceae bacterium]